MKRRACTAIIQEDNFVKIIIAGDGKVGSTLTRQLVAEGHDITLIDAKAEVLELSEERYDVMAVQGNCASMATLSRAGVQEAELLIVMTGADEVNLLCCTIAHGMLTWAIMSDSSMRTCPRNRTSPRGRSIRRSSHANVAATF